MGHCEEATRRLREALELFSPIHPSLANARATLALALVCQRDFAGADEQVRALWASFAAKPAQTRPAYARFLEVAGSVSWANRLGRSEPDARQRDPAHAALSRNLH